MFGGKVWQLIFWIMKTESKIYVQLKKLPRKREKKLRLLATKTLKKDGEKLKKLQN